MAQLKIDQVRKSFGKVDVLKGIDLDIADGEFIVLLGASGCGKSTILNLVAGFDQPDRGEVLLDGRPIHAPGPERGMVFQQPTLFPWLSVRDNVTFGPRLSGQPARQYLPEAERYLRLVGLQDFAEHFPWQLSGGMRQRAALARTLAVDPLVLLMDEPFSALDAQTKMILQQDLARTVSDEGKTVLFITHDLAEAVALSDRILVMSERPGTIIEQITVDIPGRDNPMQRRKHDRVGPLVGQLMDLLKLDANTEVH